MAVTMKCDLFWPARSEWQLSPSGGDFVLEELFEQHACIGDLPCLLLFSASEQRWYVIFECGQAAGFEHDDLLPVGCGRTEETNGTGRPFPRLREEALRDERSAAAGSGPEVDPDACTFEDVRCGESDLGVEVVGESVVEQQNALTSRMRGSTTPS